MMEVGLSVCYVALFPLEASSGNLLTIRAMIFEPYEVCVTNDSSYYELELCE